MLILSECPIERKKFYDSVMCWMGAEWFVKWPEYANTPAKRYAFKRRYGQSVVNSKGAELGVYSADGTVKLFGLYSERGQALIDEARAEYNAMSEDDQAQAMIEYMTHPVLPEIP